MARTSITRRLRRIALLQQVTGPDGSTYRPAIEYTPEALAAQRATLKTNLLAERAARRKKAGK